MIGLVVYMYKKQNLTETDRSFIVGKGHGCRSVENNHVQ